MGLKVVYIDRREISKDADARALWENVLKPKWEQLARERGEKLLAELKGVKNGTPYPSSPKMRG
jgi:hypothetical protein